jgi:hypothetical protein
VTGLRDLIGFRKHHNLGRCLSTMSGARGAVAINTRCDGPQERGHLSGDRSHSDGELLDRAAQATITGAHSRTCARKAISRTGFGSPSSRALKVSLTRAGSRYVQAASMSARRARRLPARVRPFRRIVSPVEFSAGTRPTGGRLRPRKASRRSLHPAAQSRERST